MYKFKREKQISFTDFNQPQGLQMNPNNRWIRKASMIPWETIELQYAGLFSKETGNVAKPLRMALGSLLIQKQYQPMPVEEQIAILYCGTHGLLRNIPLESVHDFEAKFLEILRTLHRADVLDVLKSGKIDDNVTKILDSVAANVTV